MLSWPPCEAYLRSMRTWSFCVLVVLAACASSRGTTREVSTSQGERSAVVIPGSEASSGVLQALRTRIPSIRITSGTGRCPHIIFRAEKSFRNQGDPSVYIDGTRMIDTCSLLDISPSDIDHIAVYESGNTPYPNVERNPFGLILIYRRSE